MRRLAGPCHSNIYSGPTNDSRWALPLPTDAWRGALVVRAQGKFDKPCALATVPVSTRRQPHFTFFSHVGGSRIALDGQLPVLQDERCRGSLATRTAANAKRFRDIARSRRAWQQGGRGSLLALSSHNTPGSTFLPPAVRARIWCY